MPTDDLIKSPSSFADRQVSWLLVLAGVVLAVGMTTIAWRAHVQIQQVTDRSAVADAAQFVDSVRQYRNFYTQLVVPRAAAQGVPFTHDYQNIQNSLPLPATFIKDFGESFSRHGGVQIRMFSDLPFPWRGQDGGARDAFESQAMQGLREDPSQAYWRIEERDGVRVLRYAVADILQESCVGCHNSYPGTPRTDWKVGDVRGVFELIRPLNDAQSATWSGFWHNYLLLLLLGVLTLVLLYVSLARLKKSYEHAQRLSHEAQASNVRLRAEMQARGAVTNALQMEQQKLHAVFRSVVDAIVVIDGKGLIRQANPAVHSIFGYQPEELIGRNVSMLVPEPHHSAHDDYVARYLNTRVPHIIGYTRQLQGQRKDGSLVDIDLAVSELQVGDEVLFAGIIRDITLRVETERLLKEARDSALESAQTKSRFMANISHELRTPLNGILGMSQLLSDALAGTEAREQARVIHASANHLLAIVNDLLDFSRLETGKLVLKPHDFHVQSWLYDTLALHIQSARDKGLSLCVSLAPGLPERVHADNQRLGQIVNNLVSNAIKFTAHGQVAVSLTLQERQLCLQVADTGLGMSDEVQTRLFRAFSQGDASSTRVYGGTGLGLAIARQLVSLMHGDIKVVSAPGKGSVFRVCLPVQAVGDGVLPGSERDLTAVMDSAGLAGVLGAAEGAAAEQPSAHMQQGLQAPDREQKVETDKEMRILLVEDNPVNQKVALALLKRLGYPVQVAEHGQQALDMLAQGGVDLILMDCQMPVLDGYEASRRIRAGEAGTEHHIPIVALTAHAMKGDDEKCYAAGMDDYLTKPINHALLKERLEYWEAWLQARAAGNPPT